ncbi:hypothetical protein SETIT_4G213900v2 [Setaria italica]|uniref:Legume lectin domain-containing protein n=1 Tax=Setaria italica TaxID=4555 RepID=K3Y287_SETIT|nr:hypothetical protein SETIT_4G213900v2 [Setaria italica]
MAASLRFVLLPSVLSFPTLVLVLMLSSQAGFLPSALARTNLTAGDTLTPPHYITSPSGGFAFGFRSLDDDDPTKFLLATWFRFSDGNSSQPQPQSVVWFAKVPPEGPTPNTTARGLVPLKWEPSWLVRQ